MKALIYSGPELFEFRDVDVPQAGKDEVLVQVDSVGICGSDMHAFLGHDERRPAPLILGHEAAGQIVGGNDDGQRVTINPLVTCGRCRACNSGKDNLCPERQIISMPPREGAFAQFVTIPKSNVITVPEGFSLEKASMVEPIACGWHAARLAQSALHQAMCRARVLVIGGGAIGVGAALSLQCQDVKDIRIIEPNQLRRDYLNTMLDIPVLEDGEQDQFGEFDLVIDAVGYEATRELASRKVSPGGVIIHIGLGSATGGLDIRRATLQEITFIGTYTYTSEDFKATAQAIFYGMLGDLDWFETRSLAEGAGAFRDIRNGKVAAPKVVLKP